MKKVMSIIIAASAMALFFTGCASDKQIKAGAGWADKYYSQPNTAEIMCIKGTNVTWTVTGATSIVLNTPVPAKSVIPREGTWSDGLFDTIRSVAPWAFMAWGVSEGAFGGGSTTINNAAPVAP